MAAPESVMMVALASIVTSAAAMDGSGKVAARSAAACEELASASLAEAVVVVVAVGAVAAAGSMVAVATSTAAFSSGTGYAAAVAMLPWEAICGGAAGSWSPEMEARVRACVRFGRAKGKNHEWQKEEEDPLRRLFNIDCAKIRAT